MRRVEISLSPERREAALLLLSKYTKALDLVQQPDACTNQGSFFFINVPTDGWMRATADASVD
jgi:hypothetical protein